MTNPISIFTLADRLERRHARRIRCDTPVEVRQQGRFMVPAEISDVTDKGCRVAGSGPYIPNFPMTVKLSPDSRYHGRIVWSCEQQAGICFDDALQPAELAGFVHTEPQLHLVD